MVCTPERLLPESPLRHSQSSLAQTESERPLIHVPDPPGRLLKEKSKLTLRGNCRYPSHVPSINQKVSEGP